MDNSSEGDSNILGLGVGEEHDTHNISFEDGTSLGTKRLHLDSESSADLDVGSLYAMGKRIKLETTCEDDMDSDLLRRASCDELGDVNGMMLGSAVRERLSSANGDADMAFSTEDENVNEDECILMQHMDIKEPLSSLKKALEETHNIDLTGYEFYLQDTTPLAGHKNLVEQCVQGCGTVQVNVQLKMESDGTKKINIVDVLKPSDSYLLASGNPAFSPATPEDQTPVPLVPQKEEEDEADKNAIRWVVDTNFKANQQRLQIPQDPKEWEVSHVRHWLLWAVRQFNLTGIKLADWKLTGAELCGLSLEDFKDRVPYDPCDIFWTHLELLRRCHFVAVMQDPEDVITSKENSEPKNMSAELDKNILLRKEKKMKTQIIAKPIREPNPITNPFTFNPNQWMTNRPGSHGQIQLWQFLLDLLTDKNHRECIQWLGAEGEFKLIEPERVAQLWGIRKNKPNMNYEKLSRALRYYYDGDMIAKVSGKRFVYKFVCDLKQLLGYSAFELNRLVIDAEMRAMNGPNDPLSHSLFGNPKFSSHK